MFVVAVGEQDWLYYVEDIVFHERIEIVDCMGVFSKGNQKPQIEVEQLKFLVKKEPIHSAQDLL